MRPTYIYALLGVLTLLLPSCLKNNKEMFDKPAAARIDALISEEKALLESAPKGWRMEYYAGRNYSGPGFTLLMKFENGHVTMAGDNVDPELLATSEYSIVRDQGPVLTFPTYNQVIHALASASLGYPEGIQGDYEFAILSAKADTIQLLGKKWGNEMRLIRISDDSSIEEQVLGILNVREGLTANTFDFALNGQPLAQGEIQGDARRLSIKIGERIFETPFNFTATGITLQSPIVLGGKSYKIFAWDSESKQFSSGDLTAKLFLPKSYKPIDFWYGTWMIKHNPIRGWRKPTTLTLSAGEKPNTLTAILTFHGVSYKMLLPYESATGSISFQGQALHDPTNKYAGGIILIPASLVDGRKFLAAEQHSITFAWDEELQQAVAKGTELADGKVDSFYGIAYGEDLNTPLQDSKGNPIIPIAIENIQYIKKQP